MRHWSQARIDQAAAARLGCSLGIIVEPRKENKQNLKYLWLGFVYMMGLSGVAVYWQADREEEERGESGGGCGEYEVKPT
jgi:hypothetical protein